MNTVPHSGTRYIRSCFVKALGGAHAYSSQAKPKPGTKLLWGHFCLKHIDHARTWYNYVGDKSFVVIRDPMAVLSTWINLGASPLATINAISAMVILDREYELKYFPVERTPISEIASWSGVALSDTKKHFSSGTNELKEAALNKDLKTFQDNVPETDLYLRVLDSAGYIYEDAGYDMWWSK